MAVVVVEEDDFWIGVGDDDDGYNNGVVVVVEFVDFLVDVVVILGEVGIVTLIIGIAIFFLNTITVIIIALSILFRYFRLLTSL